MNIYHIAIDQDGLGLSAVVIASDERAAVEALKIDLDYQYVIQARLIGVASDSFGMEPVVICWESP